MIKATLVLEGGAARGVFTAGLLDYLMEQEVYFDTVIGVSAGACNGVGYVAKQIGRAKKCMIHEDGSFSYLNIRKFLKSKSLLDMDMIFDTFPNKIFPFDYEEYFQSDMKCIIVVTNCVTGKAEYLEEKSDKQRLMKVCRGSSSIPLMSPIVNIDGVPYLDGGLSDSIPVKKALDMGAEKVVVVLTRNPGYKKKPISKGVLSVYNRAYKKYPELIKTMRRRAKQYNDRVKYIEELEREKKIFVIRPQVETVSRMESDPIKLSAFYQHGYDLMESQYDNMMKYLKEV